MSSSDSSNETGSTTPTDHHHYEFADDETPSEAVVTAVASVTDRPTAPVRTNDEAGAEPLPPLFETVNADALDAVVGGSADSSVDPEVTFSYCGVSVRVRDGLVTVSPLA